MSFLQGKNLFLKPVAFIYWMAASSGSTEWSSRCREDKSSGCTAVWEQPHCTIEEHASHKVELIGREEVATAPFNLLPSAYITTFAENRHLSVFPADL